jgi:zinc finger CCHC domain-containing protein 8
MSFSDSKEELIKRLTESGNIVDGYKRKKLRNLPSVEAEKAEEVNDLTTTSEIEMEIENVDEVKPLGVTVVDIPDSPESPEPCPPGDTLPPIIKELENYCPSPTLEQLENDKKNLLAALGESSVFLDTSEVSTVAVDCSTATIEIVDDSDSCSIVETSIINETIIENCENENTENSQIERQPEIEPIQPLPVPKTIQSTSLGAPVLPSFSGHTVLPSGEKFSKDVCDVIAFENLPDSTGKYEQMRSVISKVREKVKKIQYE